MAKLTVRRKGYTRKAFTAKRGGKTGRGPRVGLPRSLTLNFEGLTRALAIFIERLN